MSASGVGRSDALPTTGTPLIRPERPYAVITGGIAGEAAEAGRMSERTEGSGLTAARRGPFAGWFGRPRAALLEHLSPDADTEADARPPAGDATLGAPPAADTARAVDLAPADARRPPPVEVALNPARLRRSVAIVLVMLTIWLAAVWVYAAIGHFLFLLLLAWLLAIAMEPMISWLIRRGMRRGIATAITGGGGIIVGLVLVTVFGAEFINQLVVLVQTLPGTITGVIEWLNATFNLNLNPDTIVASLQITPQQVAGWASGLAGGVLGVFGSLVAVIFDLFTVAVFTFYFAGAGPRLLRSLAVWMKPDQQRVIGTVWEIAASKTGGYVISKVELAALSAIFHGIFFWAIGLDSFLPMALLVGITAQFVPVVGTYIGVAIPVLLALFQDPLDAIWIVAFSSVYQQIETYVFTPRVSRRTMDVNPAIALASVFVGAAIWGPIGALIGIPLAAAVVAVAETYGRRYQVVGELATTHVAPAEGDPPTIPGKRTDPSADDRSDGSPDPTPDDADAPDPTAAPATGPAADTSVADEAPTSAR